jgi:5,10-methylenetetrahydromethanopterin reductase
VLRFGFGHVPSEEVTRHVELVRLAEELGYDYAWIPDQTFFRDPYVVLAALALSTSRIALGVGVTNPFTRHPAMNARAIATIADMAPGRVAFGIGAGNVRELVAPLGLQSTATASRLRETAELAHHLLAGGEVSYEGEHYRMVGERLQFQPGRVPVYVAGRGPRVLEVAGEVGDGVLIGGLCNARGISYALDRVRAGADRRGRDLADLDVGSWVTCHVTDDREGTIERLRPSIAHIVGGAPDSVLEAIGLPREQVAAIKAAYRVGGGAHAAEHVDEGCVDALAIVGDAGTVAARIRELERAGVTQFIQLMPGGTVEQHAAALRRFAADVMPALRTPAPVRAVAS